MTIRTNDLFQDALLVLCPTCGARPGDRCLELSYAPERRTRRPPHYARLSQLEKCYPKEGTAKKQLS
jgi:hypothetical protein